MPQTFENIIQDLKNKVYSPVYLLQGEEPYYIDKISDFIENNVLEEMEKEFNQTVLYGKDIDLLTLISHAKRYPMMSNYQVVIVKEAQNLKGLVQKERKTEKPDKADKTENPLEVYLQNPVKSTLLVFCCKYEKVDGRSKVAKLIDKSGVTFESKKLYDNQLPDWIKKYCASKKYKIDDKAAYLLAEYLGADLSKISNELDKLMINVSNTEVISIAHIEQNIGISKDYNVFELNNAISTLDYLKANRIVNYFKANSKANPFVLTMAMLFAHFNKVLRYQCLTDKSKAAAVLGIHPGFIRDYETAARNYNIKRLVGIIALLREYDLKSKGLGSTSTDEGDLLKEMVFKIMH